MSQRRRQKQDRRKQRKQRKLNTLLLTDRPEFAGRNNYDGALRKLGATLAGQVGVHHVQIMHDSWCGIYDGGPCNCEPEVKQLASTG